MESTCVPAATAGIHGTRQSTKEERRRCSMEQATFAAVIPDPKARSHGSANSHAAAASVKRKTINEVIWEIMLALSQGSKSDEEILSTVKQFTITSPSGTRTRRKELCSIGLVEEAGTGRTASGRVCSTWELTKLGVRVMSHIYNPETNDCRAITLGKAIEEVTNNG